MKDTIYRQDAIDAVKFYETQCDPYPRVIESLQQLPSAEPNLQQNLQPTCNQLATEIIRCKDCKHRFLQDRIWQCPFAIPAFDNHFCAYAERKEDE